MNDDLRLFALGASKPLGESIARFLRIDLAEHKEREFDDG